jgi:hypothetical protein
MRLLAAQRQLMPAPWLAMHLLPTATENVCAAAATGLRHLCCVVVSTATDVLADFVMNA